MNKREIKLSDLKKTFKDLCSAQIVDRDMDMDIITHMSNACYMSIAMLHAHFYAVVHVYVYVLVRAAFLCQCCMLKSMQNGQGHAALT